MIRHISLVNRHCCHRHGTDTVNITKTVNKSFSTSRVAVKKTRPADKWDTYSSQERLLTLRWGAPVTYVNGPQRGPSGNISVWTLFRLYL
jgi:hypothetical protein